MYMEEEEEDYGLEYSEDSASEPDIDLENQYYHSKSIKNENPKAAIAAFEKVLEFQGETKGVWGFKALKQMVKINFYLKEYEKTMETYKELLTYVKQSVTKNYAEKTINSILDYTSSLKDMTILQSFYEATLEALRYAKNDRLWFKTQTKLGKVYLERGEFTKLVNVVKQLNNACKNEDGDDDLNKSNQLLEIYALQIQMYTLLQNSKLLKKVYERSLRMRSAVSHPLIMGIIRECGGKMHLREADYGKAYTDFFEAFMNYDEAGNPRRTTCLKYLILTSMLMKSSINPFDSQEAKPYKDDPEIRSLRNLINAYQTMDMKEFEKIFKEHRESLMEDAFIHEHVEELLKNVRKQVLLQRIQPYRIVKLTFLSNELNIPLDETENLIVSCILDGKIAGRIDQCKQVLVKNSNSNNVKEQRFIAIDKLATNLNNISLTLSLRLAM